MQLCAGAFVCALALVLSIAAPAAAQTRFDTAQTAFSGAVQSHYPEARALAVLAAGLLHPAPEVLKSGA